MSDLLPLATYNLNIEPYTPTPACDDKMPVTIKITMAALNPEAYDKENKPSTLRIVKRNPDFHDADYDDILNGDYDEEEMDDEEEESEEEEKSTKKNKKAKKAEKESSSEDEEDEEDESDDDEFEEYVLLTLSPKSQFQQSLDITIAPEEDIQFIVTGSYGISLTGNYIKHPFDTPIIDAEDEDSEDYDSEDYESAEDELDDLINDDEEEEDEEIRIEEIIEDDGDKSKKQNKNKKRKQESEEEKEKVTSKKVKQSKVEPKDEAPKKNNEKPKTQALEGGIIVEDRVVGKGPQAKKGSRIGMRYIGKLA